MPLSTSQKGAIGQFAFLVTALTTGKGQVEVYSPAADNEGRDAEVRRHLKPAPAIAIQVKVTLSRPSKGRWANYLSIRFTLAKNRVQNDPRLWYLCADFDPRELRFRDPLLLVPAHIFHKLARRQMWKGRIQFAVMASMAPGSRDQWSPYRVAPADLGKRLLEIIDETPLTAGSRSINLPPDAISLGRTRRPMARSKRDRAA